MKKSKNYLKLMRSTITYIVVIGILFIVLTPVYFLVQLSFLSGREAYRYPLPMRPYLKDTFRIEEGQFGYLYSIYNRDTDEFETILDTGKVDKVTSQFAKYQAINLTEEEVLAQWDAFENSPDGVYEFTLRKNIFSNYVNFFQITQDAMPSLIRSIEIAGLTILISLTIGGMAGYAFARYRFKGRSALNFSVLLVRMFPAVSIAMPMVKILIEMGLFDKPLGLSLVYSVSQIGLTVWITASIFQNIPVELEEAAEVFGATKLRTVIQVTLPLALPGLAAASMYAFIGAWNETVSALLLTQFNPTFALVVYNSSLNVAGNVNLAAAGGVAMAIPAVVFTLIIRRYLNQMWGGVSV
jgi:multiple sugar transport system permease protein